MIGLDPTAPDQTEIDVPVTRCPIFRASLGRVLEKGGSEGRLGERASVSTREREREEGSEKEGSKEMVGAALDSGQAASAGTGSVMDSHCSAAGKSVDIECGGRDAGFHGQRGGREGSSGGGGLRGRGEDDWRPLMGNGSVAMGGMPSGLITGGGGGGGGGGSALPSDREKSLAPCEFQGMACASELLSSGGLSVCSAERERLRMERFSGPDRPCAGGLDREAEKIKHQKFSGPDKLGGGGQGGGERASSRSPCGASSRSPSVGSNYSSSSLQSGSEALQKSPWQQENMKHCLINPQQLMIGEEYAAGPKASMHKGVFCKLEMAIKIIKPPETPEETERLDQAFTEEVTMSLRLRHRNVIQFVGACRRPPLWAIVTEYLDRFTLYDFIHNPRETPLDLKTIISKGLDTARGIEYLHSKQIVHRALRPQSLVMDSDGVVKVTEFGALRMQGDPDCSIGKEDLEDDDYRWMAPELIGHRPYDHKVDVYSFGIILWELLTGLIPFDGMPTVQAAVSIVNKHARPELPDTCPAGLKALITECWSPDPEKRPEFSNVVRMLEAELSMLKTSSFSSERPIKTPWSWLSCCLAAPDTHE